MTLRSTAKLISFCHSILLSTFWNITFDFFFQFVGKFIFLLTQTQMISNFLLHSWHFELISDTFCALHSHFNILFDILLLMRWWWSNCLRGVFGALFIVAFAVSNLLMEKNHLVEIEVSVILLYFSLEGENSEFSCYFDWIQIKLKKMTWK